MVWSPYHEGKKMQCCVTEELFILSKMDICNDLIARNPIWDAVLYLIRQTLYERAIVLSGVCSFETNADVTRKWDVEMLGSQKADVFKERGWTVSIYRNRIKIDFKGEPSKMFEQNSGVSVVKGESEENVRLKFYNHFAHILVNARTITHTGLEVESHRTWP